MKGEKEKFVNFIFDFGYIKPIVYCKEGEKEICFFSEKYFTHTKYNQRLEGDFRSIFGISISFFPCSRLHFSHKKIRRNERGLPSWVYRPGPCLLRRNRSFR
ncbi:hypothetical protein V6Z11_A04G050100 [Gossypium hirsutum]